MLMAVVRKLLLGYHSALKRLARSKKAIWKVKQKRKTPAKITKHPSSKPKSVLFTGAGAKSSSRETLVQTP